MALNNFFNNLRRRSKFKVDYATRYPNAEALLAMYSRLDFPEEALSDNETQFTSECMEEASRLLSISQLTSTA